MSARNRKGFLEPHAYKLTSTVLPLARLLFAFGCGCSYSLVATCAAAAAAAPCQTGAPRPPSQLHHMPAQLLESGAMADCQHLSAAAAQGPRSGRAAAAGTAEGVEQARHLQSTGA